MTPRLWRLISQSFAGRSMSSGVWRSQQPGRTTFEAWCTLERSDQPGVVYAAGGATTIWVDFPQQKAMTLPDWMRMLVTA